MDTTGSEAPRVSDAVPHLLDLVEVAESALAGAPHLEPTRALAALVAAFEDLLVPMRAGAAPRELFTGVSPVSALRVIDAAVSLRDQLDGRPAGELAAAVAATRIALVAVRNEVAPADGITVDLTDDPVVDLTGALDRAAQIGPTSAIDDDTSIRELLEWIAALVAVDDEGLAALLGVSARTVGRWASGDARPRPVNADRMRTIARAAGHLRRRLDAEQAHQWFGEAHARLDGGTPLDALADPETHGAVLTAATAPSPLTASA